MRKDNKRYTNDLALKAYSGMCLTVIASCLAAHAEEIPFIEEGKIWWYEVGEEAFWENEGWKSHIGIMTAGETEIDGEKWTECHMVDNQRNIVTISPLAYLREEGDKVYVTAGHLDNSYEEWEEDILSTYDYPDALIITTYTGFIYHQQSYAQGLGIDYVRDPANSYPALLYDFGLNDEQTFSWPWAWLYMDIYSMEMNPNKISITARGSDTYKDYSYRYWDFSDEDERTFLCELHNGRIAEGIGVIAMKSDPHSPADIFHGGFFFNPAQCLPPVESGMNSPARRPPVLKKVERPNGSIIYENVKSAVNGVHSDDSFEKESRIYDLHGREVNSPVRGAIYIRNGKKFVAE